MDKKFKKQKKLFTKAMYIISSDDMLGFKSYKLLYISLLVKYS